MGMFEKLDKDYEALKDKPIQTCTEDELRVILAYHYWKDGAEEDMVNDTLNNKDLKTYDMIETLTSVFGLEEPDLYTNHYRCSECGEEWQDDSPHTNNDRCPSCDAETEPYDSEDLL